MDEKWMMYTKRADFKALSEHFKISPVLARLIVNRDIKEENDIQKFLYGDVGDLYEPHAMKDINIAAEMIQTAIDNNERIVIASDFDVDGIFSSYILYLGFKHLGAAVSIDTPNRVTEGYGLNCRIVDDAKAGGASLIVTCDNGIAAFDAVAHAKEIGLSVIVTDHHDIPIEEKDGQRHFILPEADAIVNPKQADCEYPFERLCGAGVAFKLVQVLYENASVNPEELYELLEYTAIATVADVMDLQDENRIIVKQGLKRLVKTKNTGLQALMEVTGLNRGRISAYHIGFVLGPCFNAAGRLDTVKMALDLLMETDRTKALQYAANLKALNDSRKDLTLKGFEQAVGIVEASEIKQDKVLLILLEDCHESLVGIIAGRIKERYHKPVIVFTKVEHGRIKGSARSIEAYNMFEALTQHKELLERFGGHPMAAGLTLTEENLKPLRQALNQTAALTEDDFKPVVHIDIVMPVNYISETFINELELLEPFGKGNPKPIFAQKHFSVINGRILGKNKNVLKLMVKSPGNDIMDALYFGDIKAFNDYIIEVFGQEAVDLMYQGRKNDINLTFTYYPDINEYMGKRTIQMIIQGYRYQED